VDEQIEARLAELKREYRAGQDHLRELVEREAALRDTLLRISGAIQVLEEIRGPAGEDGRAAAADHDGAEILSVG